MKQATGQGGSVIYLCFEMETAEKKPRCDDSRYVEVLFLIRGGVLSCEKAGMASTGFRAKSYCYCTCRCCCQPTIPNQIAGIGVDRIPKRQVFCRAPPPPLPRQRDYSQRRQETDKSQGLKDAAKVPLLLLLATATAVVIMAVATSFGEGQELLGFD